MITAAELKAEYMSKFQNKEVFTCFALTEATGGTGADLHTTAVKDGDSYVLNGEKTLISHTDCCEFAYVIAVTNRIPTKMTDCPHSSYRWMHRDSKLSTCRT